MSNKVKITIIKKMNTRDIYGERLPCRLAKNQGPECPLFKVGDEFVSEESACPVGFCGWAFADIQRDIAHLWLGGNYPWIEDHGVAISCCTDGLRPVFFKIERME